MLTRSIAACRAPVRSAAAGGFTLVELMVTVAVLVVLSAMAMPSFSTFMAENRARSKMMDLVAALRTAQTEALRRNREVVFTLTNSAQATVALVGAANGKGWASVALPISGSGVTTTEVVNVGGYSEGTADVVFTGSSVAVCFLPDGSINANASTGISGATCTATAGTDVNYVLTPSRGSKKWLVAISPRGQISSCVAKTAPSGAVSCE